MKLENLMSNEIKSGNMNEQSGAGKNDPNRTTEATPKSGQQSQSTTRQGEKSSSQQGGSDHKSGQQSQGASRADDDGMKQAGSSHVANDPKKTSDAGQKTSATK
jgi:hypothetical protein